MIVAPQFERRQTDLADTESRQKIYVGTLDSTVETFDMDGRRTTPTLAWLHQPLMGAVDAGGNIYETSAGNGSMEKYDPSGFQVSPTIVNLNIPRQVVVDGGGKIYILSSGDATITAYLPDGTQSTPTIRDPEYPRAFTVDAKGKIYIANRRNNSVTTYNSDGSPSTPTITEGIVNPHGIAVDAQGLIYVANSYAHDGRSNGTVTIYNPYGNLIWVMRKIRTPNDVSVDSHGNLLVTTLDTRYPGQAGGRVRIYNAAHHWIGATPWQPFVVYGAVWTPRGNIAAFTPNGVYRYSGDLRTVNLQITPPTLSGLTVDGNGKIYVAFTNVGKSFTVAAYTPDGQLTNPRFSFPPVTPSAIAVGYDGNIYLSDGVCVDKFSPQGQMLPLFVCGLYGSAGIYVSDKLYVADYENNGGALDVFDLQGHLIRRMHVPRPTDVESDASGDMYVTLNGHDLFSYDRHGQRIKPSIYGLSYPGCFARDASGNFFVVETDANLGDIRTFAPNGVQIPPTIGGLHWPRYVAIH